MSEMVGKVGPAATIVLADDHRVVRSGLRLLLEEAGFQVVAEAGDVEEVARKVQRTSPTFSFSTSICPAARTLKRPRACGTPRRTLRS